MKRIIIILLFCIAGFKGFSQFNFPSTDSLHRYCNRFITNSAINAFTDYRMNTLLNGIINWIDTARLGTSGSVGVDTIYALNDSTIRYRKNLVNYTFNLRGNHWTLQQVLNHSSTLTSNNTITIADSLKFTSGKVIMTDSVKMSGLPSTSDSTDKPVAIDANGNVKKMTGWPVTGNINGSGATNQITYWSGTNSITGNNNFQVTPSVGRLSLASTGAGSIAIYLSHNSATVGSVGGWQDWIHAANEYPNTQPSEGIINNYTNFRGYNLTANGARVNSSEPSQIEQIERAYVVSGYGLVTEWWRGHTNANGNVIRPEYHIRSWYQRKSLHQWTATNWEWNDDSTNNNLLSLNQTGFMQLSSAHAGTQPIFLVSNTAGSGTFAIQQRNAANTANIGLITAVSDNVINIGGSGKYAQATNYTTELGGTAGYLLGTSAAQRGGLTGDHDNGSINLFSFNNAWPIRFVVQSSEKMRINGTSVGIGVTSPSAHLHIKAGTASANTAPLKLTSGTNLTTPEDGAIEYDGAHYYGTVGSTRYQLDQQASGITTIYTGDGTLASDRTVSTGGFTTDWTGSNDGETSFSVTNTGTTGASAIAGTASGTTSIGLSGTSTQYIGVLGTSTSNTAIQGQSTSGVGVIGVSTSGAAFRGQINPTSTNAIENILTLLRTSSSGGMANDGGSAIQYELETATNGTSQTAGRIGFKWTDATNVSRTSQFEIYGVNSTTTARKLALAGNGQLTLDGYGAGTFAGMPTYLVSSNASGNLQENGFRNEQSGTTYTVVSTDALKVIGLTNTAARTITLPAASSYTSGVTVWFKDEAGTAGTGNITINRAGSDTIDGATSYTISSNYGFIGLYSNGSNAWFVR